MIGAALLFYGITGLKSGTTKDKYGNELTGGVAKASSLVRTVMGIVVLGGAIYVAIFGAW